VNGTTRKFQKPAIICFKFIVIVLIFRWILQKIDLTEFRECLQQVSWFYFGFAFAVAIINRFITTAKWQLLLRHHGVPSPYFPLLRITFVSQFLGILLPSALGVDAFRLMQIQKREKNLTASVGSVFTDRMLAALAMAVLSFFAALMSLSIIQEKQIMITAMIFSGSLIVFIFFIMTPLPFKLLNSLKALVPSKSVNGGNLLKTPLLDVLKKIVRKTEEIHSFLPDLLSKWKLFGFIFLINCLFQFLRIVEVHFLFRALAVPVPWMLEIAFVPLIILLTFLPISFFGLGIKEGAFVYFFSRAGVSASIALSTSLLSYLLLLAGIVPGACFFLMGDSHTKKQWTHLKREEKNE